MRSRVGCFHCGATSWAGRCKYVGANTLDPMATRAHQAPHMVLLPESKAVIIIYSLQGPFKGDITAFMTCQTLSGFSNTKLH